MYVSYIFYEFEFLWTFLVLNPTIKLAWHRQNSSERETLRVKQLFIREVGVSFPVFLLSYRCSNNSFVLIVQVLNLVLPQTPLEPILLGLPPLVALHRLQDAQELQVASYDLILRQILCAQQRPDGQTSFSSEQSPQQLVLVPQSCIA